MGARPGHPPAAFYQKAPQKFFKKYLTARPIHAIIITVIGETMVNPKYRKEVNKENGNF